jgi:putative toxin-antitoxin system antitoxin component (TIGR02293 family)
MFARLVKEEIVLSTYDAKAIAEVLGLAFGWRPKPPAARLPRSESWRERPPSPASIEKAVEVGLPRESLRHVAQVIAGGDKARASALERSMVPRTTLERRESKLSLQESERTERVARLFVHARRALGTEAEAREFMTAPHPELDNRSPFEAAKTDLGTRRAEQILNALEYGLAI